MIYLDWAASAIPYADEIEAAYREATAVFANPSAQHGFGKEARDMLEKARSRCAAVLSVPVEMLYFTSGASVINPSCNREPCYQRYRTPVGTGTGSRVGALRLDGFNRPFR